MYRKTRSFGRVMVALVSAVVALGGLPLVLAPPANAAVQTVTGVSSTTTNGSVTIGSNAVITVTFSGSVTPTYTSGTKPYILLETGATDRQAAISSTSGVAGTTLNFLYTVQEGDVSADLDYVDANSLVLNGGTIKNGADNAVLTLPTPGNSGSLGANKALIVDGVKPTVTSVRSATADGWYGRTDVIDIDVLFSEAVTVSGSTLTIETGVDDANVSYHSGSGTNTIRYRYTVGAGAAASDLDYVATTSLSGSVTDVAGNSSTRTLPTPGAAGSLSATSQIGLMNFVATNPATNNDTALARDPDSGAFFVDSGGIGISRITADGATVSTWLSDADYPDDPFQVVGSFLYWTNGSTKIYKSPLATPARSQVAVATGKTISAFVRIAGTNYIGVSSERAIYTLADGATTPVLFATLPVGATGLYYLYPAAQSGYLLALDGVTDIVYKVNLSDGTYTSHLDLNKCATESATSNPGVTGMTRTADGVEYYGFYRASTNFARVGADGVVRCITVRVGTSGNTSLRGSYGGLAADGTSAYTVTSVDNMGAQSGFIKLTPNFTWGGPEIPHVESGDVMPPFFSSATVLGSRTAIDVVFGETLDTNVGNVPTASRFTVFSGGSAVAVSSVSVTGATVRLNLASSVSGTVEVVYSDETIGNDAAVVQDSAGNDAAAFRNIAAFSSQSPSSLDLLAADDSGTSNSDNITNSTTLRITGSAPTGSTVQLFVNGVASGSTCNESGGTFTCTTATLGAGSYSITANSTVSSVVSDPSNALAVTIDDVASVPSGLAVTAVSDSGSSNSDGITNDQTPTMSGTAEAGSVVQLSVDGTPSGATCTADATTGVFECTTMPLAEGSRTVTATATDVAGNSSSTSTATTIEIDTTAPTIPSGVLSSLTCRPTWCDSDYIAATATPSFIANAPNDTRAQLYIGGVATGSVCATSNGPSAGSFVCTTSSLVDGSYAIVAKLLDVAGNESSSSYSPRNFQVIAGYVPTTSTSSTSTTTTTTTTVPSTSSSSSSTTTTVPATTTTTIAPQTGTGRLVWYADSTVGNDASGNGSAAAPFATFHRAYTAARAGDTIDLTGAFTWTDFDESGDVVGSGYRLAKNLTIRGQGEERTIVEAAARENVADRAVFTITATVTMVDLTIRYGRVTGGGQGAGVTNRGRLTLESVTVRDNRAVTASRYSFYTAGGLFTDTNSSISLDKVTVKDNVCDCVLYAAGGLYALQSANKTITNSTFSGNRASASRIGPYAYSYAAAAGAFNTFRFGSTVISNSTFFGNYSADYAGTMSIYYQDYANLTNLTIVGNEAVLGTGGILYRSEWDGYNLNLKNVLLANNRGVGGANDFHAANEASALRMTSSHNIVEAGNNKVFGGSGEITGQQSGLDLAQVLAPNSGRNGVDTLLIGRESIAKDAGDAAAHGGRVKATPASVDQRGFARVGTVDIGAFENQSETNGPVSVTVTPSSSTSTSTTVARPTTTSVGRPSSTTNAGNQSNTSTTTLGVTEVTINPDIVATTVPTASTLPQEDAEDLTVESTTDTEVKASNDSIEIVLSIVDRNFSEVLQGRTGRLVAKQGLYAKVRGKGFLAGSLAEVWVYSSPRLLAHLQVSSKGEAAGYVLIPEDLEVGDHRVELRGNSSKRRVVKATIPLRVLDDDAPASTIPADPDEVETALTLPTEMPAVVLPAPIDGQVSIGEDVIESVLAEVLGEDADLSKVRLRIRVNKGSWQVIDTSTGRVLAVVVPSEVGENQIEFEVTDENGERIVVQRKVLVEGTPEAVAYLTQMDMSTDDGAPFWVWLLAASATLFAVFLLGLLLRRRSRDEVSD